MTDVATRAQIGRRKRVDGLRLTFLGAAGEVTGSCYLVDTVAEAKAAS